LSTSGSTNFSLNRDEVITDTLILLGVLGAEQTITVEDTNLVNRALNRMIKAWQGQGLQLWAEQQATIFLNGSSQSYSLGSSGDHASNTVVETTLDAAEASGQTVLSVTSTTGMTVGDYVGIELTDGTRQWTTITAISAGDTITVNTALTGAAASGKTVYTYTTRLARPLEIVSIRLRDSDSHDILIHNCGTEDYHAIVDKADTGQVVEWAYNPGLSTGSGTLYVWPVSDNVVERLKITYRRSIEDMDSAANDFDFPVEWLDAIIYNLAVRISPMYGKTQKLDVIAPLAAQYLADMKAGNSETGSIYAQYQA